MLQKICDRFRIMLTICIHLNQCLKSAAVCIFVCGLQRATIAHPEWKMNQTYFGVLLHNGYCCILRCIIYYKYRNVRIKRADLIEYLSNRLFFISGWKNDQCFHIGAPVLSSIGIPGASVREKLFLMV